MNLEFGCNTFPHRRCCTLAEACKSFEVHSKRNRQRCRAALWMCYIIGLATPLIIHTHCVPGRLTSLCSCGNGDLTSTFPEVLMKFQYLRYMLSALRGREPQLQMCPVQGRDLHNTATQMQGALLKIFPVVDCQMPERHVLTNWI